MKKLLTFALLSVVLILTGCSNSNKVETWNLVTLEYTGTYLDGTVFEHKEIIIQAWSGEIIKWIDDAIIGMKSWKTQDITIKPELWYADKYNKNDLQEIAKLVFDKIWIPVETDKKVTLDKITWVIKWTKKDSSWSEIVILDINPLETRQDTNYEITIKSIDKSNNNYKL